MNHENHWVNYFCLKFFYFGFILLLCFSILTDIIMNIQWSLYKAQVAQIRTTMQFLCTKQNYHGFSQNHKKKLVWSVIGNLFLHIGKNPSKAKGWQTSYVCSKQCVRQCNPRKTLQFFPSFKLTRNCYINMDIFFPWKLAI